MKIKRHLIYTCVDIKVSRTYGGCDYTVRVWEIVKKGVLRYLGEARRCNRGHCGCRHEAWQVALQDKAIARAAKRAKFPDKNYMFWRDAEERGWALDGIGAQVD